MARIRMDCVAQRPYCGRRPDGLAKIHAANLRAVSFFIRELPNIAPRRYCNMCRLCATRAICDPGTHATLPRGRSFKTNQNRAISSAGAKRDLGALTHHFRISELGVRRDTGWTTHLSLGLQEGNDFPRRSLPCCRRSRIQCRCLFAPPGHLHPCPNRPQNASRAVLEFA